MSCSHLICPGVLFFMTTILMGRRYLTMVASSPSNMVKPPSPANATTRRAGDAEAGARARRAVRRHCAPRCRSLRRQLLREFLVYFERRQRLLRELREIRVGRAGRTLEQGNRLGMIHVHVLGVGLVEILAA